MLCGYKLLDIVETMKPGSQAPGKRAIEWGKSPS